MSDPQRPRSVARTALLLLPVQAVFRGGEAIVPLLLAAWFGRNPDTDVYSFAWAYFTFAGAIVASAFQDSALIPVLADVRARSPRDLPAVAGALLAHALTYGAGLAALLGAIALAWFRLRYRGEVFVTAAFMVVPFTLYLVALAIRAFYVGLLNAHGFYTAHPVASGAGIALALGLAATFHGRLGVRILPVAWLLGELLASGILAFIARRLAGLRLTLRLTRPEPVQRFFRLVVSEVVGSAITRINPVVDQLFASFTAVIGGGTLLRYAFDVASLPTSVAQATVLPVLLSHFSSISATGDLRAFRRHVERALWVVCSLLLAMSAILVLFRRPVLRLVFLHGEMDSAGVDAMANLLPYALAGAAPFGALLILARAHVALQNSRIMISMGVFNATMNLALDFVLFRVLGLRGLLLSTSLMQLAVAALFWVRLRARLEAPPHA